MSASVVRVTVSHVYWPRWWPNLKTLDGEHFAYHLLFPRNWCLSKANTLHHTQTHRHTHTHMRRCLMNIAEQQVITHTSLISLCCVHWVHVLQLPTQTRANADAPTRTSSPAPLAIWWRLGPAQARCLVQIFCLCHSNSGKPGCELTPSCFSRLPCYAWHLFHAHACTHAHRHTHTHTHMHTNCMFAICY